MVVDIAFPKYMDTSLMDVDVQPTYFRVTIKKPEKHDKILQLLFPAEVRSGECIAKRSQNTGSLQLTIPKLIWEKPTVEEDGVRRRPDHASNIPTIGGKESKGRRSKGVVNIKNMAKESPNATTVEMDMRPAAMPQDVDSDFVDDPECPPLE